MAGKRSGTRSEAWTAAEVAGLLDVPMERLERALTIKATGLFPGAWRDEATGTWMVPAREIRALVTGRMPLRLLSIQTVADMLEASYTHTFRRIKSGEFPVRLIEVPGLGIQRVPESDVWEACGLKLR